MQRIDLIFNKDYLLERKKHKFRIGSTISKRKRLKRNYPAVYWLKN